MNRYLIAALVGLLAGEAGAQVVAPKGGAFGEASAILGAQGSELLVPPVGSAVSAAPGPQGAASEEELRKAKAQLERTIERLKAMIARETDRDRKLELYDSLQETQAALDSVSRALAAMTDGRSAQVQQAIDEALLLQKVLGSYLGEADFSNTVHLRRQPFEIQVGGDIVYEAISRRLPFLGGAAGGRVRINPGAAMVSQFNSLKAEYYGSLLKASSLASEPRHKQILRSLTKWGHEQRVIYPGQGWMQAQEIISWKQHNDLIDALR